MKALAAGVVALLLAGCTTAATTSASPDPSLRGRSSRSHTARPSTSPASTATRGSGLRTCDLADLPPQAADTARLVVAGGPFPYRRNDGVTYFNRNGLLPTRQTGRYREFTVRTPGATTRGTRRIITDGNPTSGAPTTTPSAWYYTGDHYNSFCALTGTPS